MDFDALVATAPKFAAPGQPLPTGATSRRRRAAGFRVLHKTSATQEYVLQMTDGPAADDRRPLRRQDAGHDAGGRFGQPALLGTGRSGPGRARQPEPLRLPRGGLFMTYMSCEAEQAAENLGRIAEIYRQAEAGGVTAGRTGPGQKQNQLARGALGASGRGAGCSAWATIGCSAANIARCARSSADRRRHAARRGRGAGPFSALGQHDRGHWPARFARLERAGKV